MCCIACLLIAAAFHGSAMFAVYWLSRIGIDGEAGIARGVDDRWRPKPPPVLSSDSLLADDAAARVDFSVMTAVNESFTAIALTVAS